MDFHYFIDTLRRRKWLLLGVMALAGATAFAVISALPPQYRANTQIKTSFVDYRGKVLERDEKYVQKWQVDNAFSNTITKLTGREMLGRLTELMLRHDLTSSAPFRQPEPEALAELSELGIETVRRVLVSRADSASTTLGGPVAGNGVRVDKLAEAYGYDFDALQKLIEVKRIGDTDYLDISFVTESPELSYFMVKEYVRLYLEDFRANQTDEELTDLNFYSGRVRDLKADIDSLQREIDTYKRGKAVVDLEEQQRAVVGQLRDIEADIEERRKEIRGYENALAAIRADRMTAGRTKAERSSRIAIANSRLDRVKRELAELNARLSDAPDRATVESLIADKKTERDRYIEEVATLKRVGDAKYDDRILDLEQQELDAEIELAAARRAVESMDRERRRLLGRRGGLVNDEAYLAQLQSEMGILRAEYNDAVGKRDESDVIYAKREEPLRIVEPPEVPDEHESRHRLVVSAFSALSAGTLTALGLFLFAIVDTRLRNPDQMRTLTGHAPLATLTAIDTKRYGLGRLFTDGKLPARAQVWIEGIRSLRYAVEQSGARVIGVTSLAEGAGKSAVLAGLATALARANRRVLLVDLNFKHNTLSAYASSTAGGEHPFELDYDEDALPDAEGWYELGGVDVVGNLGGQRSLSEVLAGTDFAVKLGFLAEEYDYILLESPALARYADGRELAEYADGLLCVLDARRGLDAADRDAMAWVSAQGDKFLGFVLNGVDPKMLG